MHLQTNPHQHWIELSESSQIGEARRWATLLARRAGLDEAGCGKAAIVASEMATNVIRHASRGEMLIQCNDVRRNSVELIAVDRGPGMDVARCMADGYSTAGSLGQGLGAIRRLSATMDIYSAPSRGTAVFARIAAERHENPTTSESNWCGISVPAPGELECGDNWRVARSQDLLSAVVADGLGHGPLAAVAANAAMAAFERDPFAAPERYLAAVHQTLHGTRGAALACAQIDLRRQCVLYAGIGNISATILSHATQQSQALPSHNGTVGLQIGRVQQFQYRAVEDDLLMMHSDGLTSRWKLADYSGLSRRSPALIAAILYRDFKRGQDDATVLVARLK